MQIIRQDPEKILMAHFANVETAEKVISPGLRIQNYFYFVDMLYVRNGDSV